MARSKALKIAARPLPTSRDEVNQLIAEIGEAQRRRQSIELAMNEDIGATKKAAEEAAKPHNAAIAEKLATVHAWCVANRASITDDGATKTVKFAAGEASWRNRPPAVSLVKGTKAEDVIASLLGLGARFAHFLRPKHEIDKEAMLKEADLARTVPGVRIGSAGEDFALRPIALQLEEVVR